MFPCLDRRFYSELSSCEYSTEKVCQCFLRNDEVFLSYVHYVGNMAQGLGVLTQYGGTFFEGRVCDIVWTICECL